jgi:class 3 adenylate cyclase/pimeloyl-ACP methyl ester carboxylesterase
MTYPLGRSGAVSLDSRRATKGVRSSNPGGRFVSSAASIRYATTADGIEVAYQVVGSGPIEVLYIPGELNHLAAAEHSEGFKHFLQRLTRFARVVLFDKRGTGLSERLQSVHPPPLEDRASDAVAVLEAAGLEKPTVFATADGCPVALFLAATHPHVVSKLIVYAASARLLETPGYPIGQPPPDWGVVMERFQRHWGNDAAPLAVHALIPRVANEPAACRALAQLQRLAGTPKSQAAYWRMILETDVRDVLSAVVAPTLVLHSRGDQLYPLAQAQFVATEISSARLLELPGNDHFNIFFEEDAASMADIIEEFVTGASPAASVDRVLAAVLFTDIVSSTQRSATVGDRRWRFLLDRHDEVVLQQVERFRGRFIKSTGDGVLATFDGPARAVRCALATRQRLAELALEIRVGIHCGEIELRDDDVSGLAVAMAQRIMGTARGGEILVSSTVRDLVLGSEVQFVAVGERDLKGVPGRVQLHRVEQ